MRLVLSCGAALEWRPHAAAVANISLSLAAALLSHHRCGCLYLSFSHSPRSLPRGAKTLELGILSRCAELELKLKLGSLSLVRIGGLRVPLGGLSRCAESEMEMELWSLSCGGAGGSEGARLRRWRISLFFWLRPRSLLKTLQLLVVARGLSLGPPLAQTSL